MKTFFTILLLLFLLILIGTAPVSAQFAVTQTLKLGRAYADNQADTTSSVQVGAYSRVGALFTTKDSVNATIYVESQTKNSSAWILKDSLAISSTSNTGTEVEWILRDNVTEKVPGVSNLIRFRPKFLTNNGTSTAKYDLMLFLSR